MPKNLHSVPKLTMPEDAYADMPMEEVDFLYESNLIENERSMEALEDAIAAWDYAKKERNKLLSDDLNEAEKYVLEIHRLLGQRIAPGIAGKFRDCDVWIGGQHKRFINETLLRAQLHEWLRESKPKESYRKKSVAQREALVKKWHIAYEAAHVTTDINGRNGRILYQIHRLILGLPIKVIDAFTKYENYYPWFK